MRGVRTTIAPNEEQDVKGVRYFRDCVNCVFAIDAPSLKVWRPRWRASLWI